MAIYWTKLAFFIISLFRASIAATLCFRGAEASGQDLPLLLSCFSLDRESPDYVGS